MVTVDFVIGASLEVSPGRGIGRTECLNDLGKADYGPSTRCPLWKVIPRLFDQAEPTFVHVAESVIISRIATARLWSASRSD